MLIQKYKRSWINDFNKIKKVLQTELKNAFTTIEHVGSTSIPNLSAKPIIDIDIIFTKEISFKVVEKCLSNLGYNHIGNLDIENREVFKRENRKEDHSILDAIQHHLYVCPIDSKELQRHLAFRDYLRTHKTERMEYENLKISIAEKANQDRKKYAEIKETLARDFVEAILKKAEI